MNVVKCTAGHYFDTDVYERCPHCGAASMAEGGGIPQKSETKPQGKFSWMRKKPKNEPEFTQTEKSEPDIGWPGPPTGNFFDDPTEPLPDDGYIPVEPDKIFKDQKTLDFWDDVSSGKEIQTTTDDDDVEKENEENGFSFDSSGIDTQEPVDEKMKPQEEKKPTELQETIRNASASNDGKTVSYFSAVTAAKTSEEKKDNHPAVNKSTSSASDPVVGWLVCVKGVHFGESFYIGTGKNSIGRNSDNRIVVWADKTISRVKHALIVYEPKKKQFYLQPGDSSGLTYLNDEYITESKIMKAHDVIELGESKFVFIPLCGDSFSWEDYISKE
ncbi:MAG: FHA domain-containing protein [Clostridia bacterium]|nr:FHA domain-containing protein [Clostridia bacterium]